MTYQKYQAWKKTPLTGEPVLSVIIPAYNEKERIIPTVGAIAAYLSDAIGDFELIVADDGSKDTTVQLLQELDLANLHVLVAEQNGGKGSAVQRGMLAARGKYVLFTDADNSTPIEEVDKLIAKLDEGFDLAIGSRAASGAEVENKGFIRQMLSDGLNWIVRTVFRITVKDTQCGFKMYTREAAQRLHTAQTIKGFSFDLEILYLASKLGYKIAEVPIRWFDAPGSKVDPLKEVQRFLRDLINIKLRDLRGEYAHA